MVRQERARRTRSALLHAAAAVFDEQGYGGASFTQICKRVGISMGALTYHFSAKDDLVAAIRAEGRATTWSTVDRVMSDTSPPLCAAVELTLAVTELLGTDAAVRATARLSRERPTLEPAWTSLWAEPLGDLIHRASADQALRADVDPDTLTALAVHLVTGAEAVLSQGRHRRGARPDDSTTEELGRIWRLILPGITASPA